MNDLILDFVTEVSAGNIGAASFVMDAFNKCPDKAPLALMRMKEFEITGEKLYLLWNDCCERDTVNAVEVMCNENIQEIKKHIDHIYKHGRCIPFKNKGI